MARAAAGGQVAGFFWAQTGRFRATVSRPSVGGRRLAAAGSRPRVRGPGGRLMPLAPSDCASRRARLPPRAASGTSGSNSSAPPTRPRVRGLRRMARRRRGTWGLGSTVRRCGGVRGLRSFVRRGGGVRARPVAVGAQCRCCGAPPAAPGGVSGLRVPDRHRKRRVARPSAAPRRAAAASQLPLGAVFSSAVRTLFRAGCGRDRHACRTACLVLRFRHLCGPAAVSRGPSSGSQPAPS